MCIKGARRQMLPLLADCHQRWLELSTPYSGIGRRDPAVDPHAPVTLITSRGPRPQRNICSCWCTPEQSKRAQGCFCWLHGRGTNLVWEAMPTALGGNAPANTSPGLRHQLSKLSQGKTQQVLADPIPSVGHTYPKGLWIRACKLRAATTDVDNFCGLVGRRKFFTES